MANVRFNYLYRDAANYKAFGEVVFANPDNLAIKSADRRLCARFDSGEFFIASQLGIPEVFLWKQGEFPLDVADHCFHEFSGLEETDDPATDSRTLAEFVRAVELVTHWAVFDPAGMWP